MSRQPPARVWNRIYLVFVCSVGTERYQLTERQPVFFDSHRSERFYRSRSLQVVDVTHPPLNNSIRSRSMFSHLPRLSCLSDALFPWSILYSPRRYPIPYENSRPRPSRTSLHNATPFVPHRQPHCRTAAHRGNLITPSELSSERLVLINLLVSNDERHIIQ